MRPTLFPARRFFAVMAVLPVAATIFSPLASEAFAIPPRAERVANRMAERRYARMSIAEARAARAEARVAEIAPAVPLPPPPRPATVRRMARAGVPLGGSPLAGGGSPPVPTAGSAVVTTPPPRPSAPAGRPDAVADTGARPATEEPATGAWKLDPDPAGGPAVTADGTRSVLAAGGEAPSVPPGSAPDAVRSSPAVTQPPVELLPTPAAK